MDAAGVAPGPAEVQPLPRSAAPLTKRAIVVVLELAAGGRLRNSGSLEPLSELDGRPSKRQTTNTGWAAGSHASQSLGQLGPLRSAGGPNNDRPFIIIITGGFRIAPDLTFAGDNLNLAPGEAD